MLIGFLLLTTFASAAPADVAQCPEVFGDAAARRYGAALADYQIRKVRIDHEGVTLFHSVGAWREVEPTRFSGVQLETVQGRDAVLRLERPSSSPCSGRFRVHVGDAIGAGRTIVALLPDGILVGSERALYFVSLDDTDDDAPVELIWQSGYHLLGVSVGPGNASRSAAMPAKSSMAKLAKPNLTAPARARPAVKPTARTSPRGRPRVK